MVAVTVSDSLIQVNPYLKHIIYLKFIESGWGSDVTMTNQYLADDYIKKIFGNGTPHICFNKNGITAVMTHIDIKFQNSNTKEVIYKSSLGAIHEMDLIEFEEYLMEHLL